MTAILDKLAAILRRDMLTAIRHRSGFVVTLVGMFVELAAFYYLSRAIGPGFRPDGIDYFPFLLVGTGLYTFFVMSAQAFLSAVQEAQQTGTLEVLMTTSTPPAELIILSSISAFAGSLVESGGLSGRWSHDLPGGGPRQYFVVPGSVDSFAGDCAGAGNRGRHAPGGVSERLGAGMAAGFRIVVTKRSHVPDPKLAARRW